MDGLAVRIRVGVELAEDGPLRTIGAKPKQARRSEDGDGAAFCGQLRRRQPTGPFFLCIHLNPTTGTGLLFC